jgi:hypothetical protein
MLGSVQATYASMEAAGHYTSGAICNATCGNIYIKELCREAIAS